MASMIPFTRRERSMHITFTLACDSLDRGSRLHALAQHELLDLPGRRLGDHAEHHASRALEAREQAAAVLDDLLFGGARIRLELDERARRLAPLRVGLRHHGGREHRRVAVDRVLDLERRDVLAAGDDDVIAAVLYLRVAVGL